MSRVVVAIENGDDLAEAEGIAFCRNGEPGETSPASMIQDLDAYRVGWELVDLSQYSSYGGQCAVVIQFSRGCPQLCTYCKQRGLWALWRHRDAKKRPSKLPGCTVCTASHS